MIKLAHAGVEAHSLFACRSVCDSITHVGLALSMTAVFQVARVSVPTYFETFGGRVTREKVDERLHEFARRTIANARIQLDVSGSDRVAVDRSYVYMSNHQSHMDIPVLYATMPSPTVRMVAKKELFRVPVWGRAMKAAGMILVDRSSRESAIESLREAGEQFASGVSVWIAPEGTRSKDGTIGKLKKGGFHLAIETGTPIVPVAISGTRNVLPKGGARMKHDVSVRVIYGAPIEVDGRAVDSLMEEVDKFFRDNVAEL
jgi:1-acyl-sn-glycerol-3-phosphate acyltransferase